jgi:hypothetical protein
MCNFIAYYRVSTKKQGKSGLGLDSQKEIIQNYLKDGDQLIAEFTEIESGRKDTRVELSNAINLAKRNNATLLIAKLDRFSRRVSFIASMMESGIKFVVAELPSASDFQLHIHAAIAQEERRLISERTKSALAQAKKRGVELGKNGKILSLQNHETKMKFVKTIVQTNESLLSSKKSYSEIARELNQIGLPTFKNKRWYPSTVRNYVLSIRD